MSMALKRTPYRGVVVHHTATADGTGHLDFDNLWASHMRRGFGDIGYHEVIERVEGHWIRIRGRSLRFKGAHCLARRQNHSKIGIAVVGNFDKTPFSLNAMNILVEATLEYAWTFGFGAEPGELDGHRDYESTACPGKFFDTERWRQRVRLELDRQRRWGSSSVQHT